MIELCVLRVFILMSLLRREGEVRERDGSPTLPYSFNLPRTTDSLSSSFSYESTIDLISSTSSIFLRDILSSLKDFTFVLTSPTTDLLVYTRDFAVSIFDLLVYIFDL